MGARLDETTAGEDGRERSGRRRRRFAAAQAAASAGGLLSLSAVLLGTPALAAQAHAVRTPHSPTASASTQVGVTTTDRWTGSARSSER